MENKWNLFEKFLITENVNLSINDFIIASVLVVVMTWLLSLTYQKVARSLSNKKDFSANFMVLAFTTMLIITIVKSSLALSLGLVGALSIVRFRSAIKEPEELGFLFISIAIGLGLGANQIYIVVVAFVILMAILWGRHFFTKSDSSQNLFITLTSVGDKEILLKEIQKLMNNNFSNFQLKRFDENSGMVEIAYVAGVKNIEKLEVFRNEVKSKYPEISISYLDSKAY